METRRAISFVILEVSILFWITYALLDQEYKQSTLVIPFLHFTILILKVILLRKSYRYQHYFISLCLLFQAIISGIITLQFDSIGVHYLQTIVLIEYFIGFAPSYLKVACLLNLYYLLAELFNQANTFSIYIQFGILFVISQSCSILTYYKKQTKKESPALKEEPDSIMEQTSFKLSSKNKIISLMPFMEHQHFVLLNENLELLYNQVDLGSLVELTNYDDSNLVNLLLDLKPEAISNTLSQLLHSDKQVQKHRLQDIRSYCQQIIQSNSTQKYYSVSEFGNRAFTLQSIKINIILLQLGCEYNILLHLEEVPMKCYWGGMTIKSYSLAPSQKSQNQSQESVSSLMLGNIFSSISHEFGTYLNCILTVCCESIRDKSIPTDIVQYYLQPICTNTKLLQYILQNIRDFNSILLQQFQLRLQQFNPYEQLQEVVVLIREQLEQRNNQLQLNCPQNLVIYNDSDRFKQIIYQILSNAIRFTQDGIIRVDIISKVDSLNISVVDTGIGMTSQEQSRLGDLLRDSRKMLKISHNSVGCGLGLSISNSIAQLMSGGRRGGINFSSILNKGSQFNFTISNSYHLYNESVYQKSQSFIKQVSHNFYIDYQASDSDSKPKLTLSPADQSEIRQQLQVRAQQHSYKQFVEVQQDSKSQNKIDSPFDEDSYISPINRQDIPTMEPNFKTNILEYKLSSTCCSRVLIVDDEYFNILSLQIVLKKFNARCDKAFNGLQALNMADKKTKNPCPNCKNWGYMVYLLDINMPVMDGLDTVKELKRRMNDKLIPKGLCIANTGYSDLETKQKALQAGMDYYLTKPIKVNELENYLNNKFRNNI